MAFNANGFMRSVPPVTRNLLIINIGLWLIGCFMPEFNLGTIIPRLGLHFWGSDMFNPIQPVSYLFLQAPLSQGGIAHIFFNMWALYMFGRILEATWGSKRYLIFYFVSGIGAGLVQELVWQLSWQSEYISAIAQLNHLSVPETAARIHEALSSSDASVLAGMENFKSSMITIGASGAIFGLLLGFGCVFPNVPMYIMFIPVPIKAKWLVAGYAVIELVFGATGALSSVAHYAHLGGMLFAAPIIYYWYKQGTLHGKRY